MRKGSKLYSILAMKCPRCHGGSLFKHKISSLKGILMMNEQCDQCGQVYELEPGFYWGSMYIAYGLSSGFILSTFIVLRFLLAYTMMQSYIAVSIATIFMIPIVFRLARSLWINLYVKYDPKAQKRYKEKQ